MFSVASGKGPAVFVNKQGVGMDYIDRHLLRKWLLHGNDTHRIAKKPNYNEIINVTIHAISSVSWKQMLTSN